MALDTFSGLKSAIATVAVRTDQTAMIPIFIAQVEAAVMAGDPQRGIDPLRVNAMETTAPLTLGTSGVVTAPTDFLGPISLVLDGGGPELDHPTLRTLNTLLTDRDRYPAKPRCYALAGTTFKLSPTPDQSYAATLTYYQRLPALSDANPTNWLLTNYPSVYLYGALLYMAPVIQEDERLPTWAALYTSALTGCVAAEDAKVGQLDHPLFTASDVPRRRRTFNINTG